MAARRRHDLSAGAWRAQQFRARTADEPVRERYGAGRLRSPSRLREGRRSARFDGHGFDLGRRHTGRREVDDRERDRKSVGQGKSWSGRVEFGGRRTLKKKTKQRKRA